jgi:hypothetical protein
MDEPFFLPGEFCFVFAVAADVERDVSDSTVKIRKRGSRNRRLTVKKLQEYPLHRVFRRSKIQAAATPVCRQRAAVLLIEILHLDSCELVDFQRLRPASQPFH